MILSQFNYKVMPVVVQKLWVLYFLDFIYSGLLRGFLPNQVSNIIFFARFMIIALLVFFFLKSGTLLDPFARFFVLVSCLLLGFQLILFINMQLNFQTFIYGIYLYVVPFLGIAIAKGMDVSLILNRYFSIMKIAIPLNLLVSLLQTVFHFEALYSAGFGTGLYSSGGVQRSTGTFSSSVGLSLFTTTTCILLMAIHVLKIARVPQYLWISICFLILISGSRTTFLNFGFLVFGILIVKNTRNRLHKSSRLRRFFILVSFLFATSLPFLLSVYIAGLNRLKDANAINPPLSRLLQQLSLAGYQVDLFGTGLGTRALGAVNNSDRRILYANWVEFDNARILVEAGLIFFLLIWLAKLSLLIHISNQKGRLTIDERIVINIALLGLVPYLLFAQIFGQGTLSSGVFLIVYILLAVPYRESNTLA